MSKMAMTFRVSNECAERINRYAKENNVTKSAAFEKMICDYDKLSNTNVADILADAVAEKTADYLYKILTRIRLGTNDASKNTMILIELLNGIYNFNELPGLVSTDENMHVGVQKAKSVVSARIKNWQMLKEQKSHNGITDESDE